MLLPNFIKFLNLLLLTLTLSTCGNKNESAYVTFEIDTSALMAAAVSINGVHIFGLHLDTGDRFSYVVPEDVQNIEYEYPDPLPPGNWQFRFMAYEHMESGLARAQIWCEKFDIFLSGIVTVSGILDKAKCQSNLFSGAYLTSAYMAYDTDDNLFRQLRIKTCNNIDFSSAATAYNNNCGTAVTNPSSFKVVIPSYPLVPSNIPIGELITLNNIVSPPIHSNCMGSAISGSNYDGLLLIDKVQLPIPPPNTKDLYGFLYVYKGQTNCTGQAHVYPIKPGSPAAFGADIWPLTGANEDIWDDFDMYVNFDHAAPTINTPVWN